MTSLGPETDPFINLGLPPNFSDFVVTALKRGRNAEGCPINVSRSDGEVVPIEQQELRIINDAANFVCGPDGPRQVVSLIADIILE